MLLTLHPEARMGQDVRAPVNLPLPVASEGDRGHRGRGLRETLVVVGHRCRAGGGWMGRLVPPSSVAAWVERQV
jgi:hypothetical protein